jgi:hypothetical protein
MQVDLSGSDCIHGAPPVQHTATKTTSDNLNAPTLIVKIAAQPQSTATSHGNPAREENMPAQTSARRLSSQAAATYVPPLPKPALQMTPNKKGPSRIPQNKHKARGFKKSAGNDA